MQEARCEERLKLSNIWKRFKNILSSSETEDAIELHR